MEKIAYGITTTTYTNSLGYKTTRVYVAPGYLVPLTDTIDGCVDNKAGYYDPHAATRVAQIADALTEEGFTHTFQHTHEFSCEIDYQHFEGDSFCSPHIKVDGRAKQVLAVAKLVEKLTKAAGGWFPTSPTDLHEALAKLRTPSYDLPEAKYAALLPVGAKFTANKKAA